MQCETKINNYSLIIFRALVVLSIIFFSLNYSQNAAASEKTEENKESSQQPSDQVPKADIPRIETMQKIYQAQIDGKYVFLLFYETGNTDCDTMIQRLDDFAQHTDQKIEIVKIDRKNPENSMIVSSMRVQFAPIPLILVKDPTGRVVKSFKTVVPEEDLAYAIPSPKKTEAMASLQEGKSLIISFVSDSMPAGDKIEESCEQAEKKLDGKAAHITVDVTDPKEKGFLKEFNIDPDSMEPVAIVINSQRQIAGTYAGEVKVEELVLAATKVAAGGGCSPGGCGGSKSCGPAKQ